MMVELQHEQEEKLLVEKELKVRIGELEEEVRVTKKAIDEL